MVEHKGVIEMDTMTAVPERVKHCLIGSKVYIWDSHIHAGQEKGETRLSDVDYFRHRSHSIST